MILGRFSDFPAFFHKQTPTWSHFSTILKTHTRTMPTTATAALRAYMAAGALTGVQHQVVDRLIISLMAELDEAADTAYQSLADYIVGRDKPDVWREIGLNHAAYGRAAAQPSAKRQGVGESCFMACVLLWVVL